MRKKQGRSTGLRTGMIECLTLALLVTLSVSGRAKAAEHGHGEHEGGHRHRHHAAVFVGNTHSTAEDEDAFTVGIDYEYRITELLGAGMLYDYAGGDIEAHVAAAALFVHPVAGLKLQAGAGVEHNEAHDEDEFLVRIGVLYDWHIGRCSVSPTFLVDFVDDEESYVYGLSFGVGF